VPEPFRADLQSLDLGGLGGGLRCLSINDLVSEIVRVSRSGEVVN